MPTLSYESTLPLDGEKPTVDWGKIYPRGEDTLSLAREMVGYYIQNSREGDILPLALFQEQEIVKQVYCRLRKKNTLLLAGTGTGKTFMILLSIDIMEMFGYLASYKARSGRNVIPFPYLYLVNASSVPQIKAEVDKMRYVKGMVYVTNYESLRTSTSLCAALTQRIPLPATWNGYDTTTGHPHITKLWDLIMENQRDESRAETIVRSWNPILMPIGIIRDEVQKLKNNWSIQTRTAQAFTLLNNENPDVFEISASASPFVKVSESRSINLSLRPDNILTPQDEMEWLCDKIVLTGKANEYHPANMARLTESYHAGEQLLHVRDVRFKRKSMNKHMLITFQSKEKETYYLEALIRYYEILAKTNRSAPGGQAAIWAAQTAFRKASEFCRYDVIADILAAQEKEGRNVLGGFIFKDTLDAVLERLITHHGYKREDISIIRGGQSKEERWAEINKFQDEKSHIALLMQAAGGTGLSMHHYKPRNTRPRFVVTGPVWSIIDQLQFLGRAHRINSESTTHQWILWYKGTIEEDVYERLQDKAMSMRELMRKKEDWSQLFVKASLRHTVDIRGDTSRLTSLAADTTKEGDDEDDEVDVWNADEEMLSGNVENT